jgi:small conductance mechanosensitive channel
MEDFIRGIVTRLQTELDLETLGSGVAAFLSNLVVGLLIFAAFYILWWVLHHIMRYLLTQTRIDATTASFIQTVLQYMLLTIGVVQASSAVGINMAAVVASLGIAGLTVGFAARDALSNLISGILIFWDRPFVIGDLVEVGDEYGQVDKITLRSTRIVTVDGKMLAVPNTKIINSTVVSYTNFPNLRLDIDVTIAVTEDIDHVRTVLLDLVSQDADFLDKPPPRVVVVALNNYNLALQLQVWLDDERQHIPKRFELRERVFEALTHAGVEMPFETIQIIPIELKTNDRIG